MDLQLRGKTAMVTGASVGLGRCMALMLAREGCELALVARREPLLNILAQEIQSQGGAKPLVVVCDITQPNASELIREQVIQRWGGLDILINNAGGSRPFAGIGTREQWDDAMNLNFHAGRELTHALLPYMQKRGFGRIVNLTGPDEPMTMNGGVPPNGAVHLWSKALSRHVGANGITVNSIAPGRIHSEQVDQKLLPTPQAQQAWVAANVPAGYIGEPEDLGALVCFLVSPLARYITGQVIHVDGGARRAAS
ncbi:MAG: SDR family oxidoreductase [Betaproteobacteria bacterium]|nr:SDR family oxidoreductase [Betaproteobacteria bacterium]NBY04611.1 SDR family oxidoreductase [Betaproteobacteria bacterium]